MKKVIKTGIILVLIVGILTVIANVNNKKIVDVNDIKTDDKFENVIYNNTEEILDESVLGVLTIGKIGLKATVKEGTADEVLLNYIGHIEGTAIYDGNIGLAAHNRGYENSYFARLNELEIGDQIKYKTKFYDKIYIIDNIQVIDETDWTLLQDTVENKITMITCIANKAEQRLCVQATEMT